MSGHKNNLKKNRHANTHLQNAINKYGVENFKFETVLICSPDKRKFYEQSCMDFYKVTNREFGYNLSLSASHPDHSEETRKKMSLAVQKAMSEGRVRGHHTPHSEEAKARMREGQARSKREGKIMGHRKPHTEEAKRKCGLANIGKKSPLRGIPRTEEDKAKMSKGLRDFFSSPEGQEKIIASRKTHCHLGHPMSGENLYIAPKSKKRYCKKCSRDRLKEYKRKKRAEKLS